MYVYNGQAETKPGVAKSNARAKTRAWPSTDKTGTYFPWRDGLPHVRTQAYKHPAIQEFSSSQLAAGTPRRRAPALQPEMWLISVATPLCGVSHGIDYPRP